MILPLPYQEERTPILGELLSAARRRAGRGVCDVAMSAGIPTARYTEIEAGTSRPTSLEFAGIVAAVGLVGPHLVEALVVMADPVAVRPAIQSFAIGIELKLRAREARGDWAADTATGRPAMSLSTAVDHAYQELAELAEALGTGDTIGIIDEAIDVGAQALIAWDLARAPYTSQDRGRRVAEAPAQEFALYFEGLVANRLRLTAVSRPHG